MAGLKIDGVVVAEYAKGVDSAADELASAAADASGELVTAESYGRLGALVGLGESYSRAAEALQRQLTDGAAALRSAAEALGKVTARHADQDSESADLIRRAGELPS